MNPVRYNLDIFGVARVDPGWVYMIEYAGRLKVGTTRSPEKRLKDARTWLPGLKVIGMKPFWSAKYLENRLHVGLSQFWVEQEWFDFKGDEWEETLKEEFAEFYDDDRDSNSVDFIYWYNSSGMAELSLEQSGRGMSVNSFQRHVRHMK